MRNEVGLVPRSENDKSKMWERIKRERRRGLKFQEGYRNCGIDDDLGLLNFVGSQNARDSDTNYQKSMRFLYVWSAYFPIGVVSDLLCGRSESSH